MRGREVDPLDKRISHPGKEPHSPGIQWAWPQPLPSDQASPLEDGHDSGNVTRMDYRDQLGFQAGGWWGGETCSLGVVS